MIHKTLLFAAILSVAGSCEKNVENSAATTGVVIDVDAGKFLTSTGSVTITKEDHALSNGTTALCYKIVTKSNPADHERGPWCPTNISDDASKGGIWMSGGNVYDVDGAFIKNLATFYNDTTWQMYNTATGSSPKHSHRLIVRLPPTPMWEKLIKIIAWNVCRLTYLP